MGLQTKSILRKKLQAQRLAIAQDIRMHSNHMIIERLIQMVSWQEVRYLHCYVPIKSRAEVDTWPLFIYVWKTWPHITTVVPGRLQSSWPAAYVVDVSTSWYETSAAPLPIEEVPMADQSFDLIVVPCLGFDGEHYRLGYGGGYYDRLLSRQIGSETIGLSYWAGYVAGGLPHEQHDVPLRRIVTENRTL